jgi:DtxR family Mn-dependent transcriptional regulator
MLITSSMREYLATIYHLQQYEYRLQVNAISIAEYLEVSSPAVTRMFKRLEAEGLILRSKYGPELTIEGTAEASKGLRWQRILECFLFQKLGFEWHELHDRARTMINGVDDKIIEQMALVLNEPKLSPYGEYIPPFDGLMPRCEDDVLEFVIYKAERVVISRIRTHDIEIKNQLEELEIFEGMAIDIVRIESVLEREMYFCTEKRNYYLPDNYLSAIWVKEADQSPRPIDWIGMHLWATMYLKSRANGEVIQIKRTREMQTNSINLVEEKDLAQGD